MSEHGKVTLTCPVKVSLTFVTEPSGESSENEACSENGAGHGGRSAAGIALPCPHPVRVREHVHAKEQTRVPHHMPCGLEELPALRGGKSGGRLPISVALFEAWAVTRALVLPYMGP